jgi:hypothetical protein
MRLAQKKSPAAAIAALLDSGARTRMLAWAVTALRERRIAKGQASELTRCAAEFTKLSCLQLEYVKAVGEKRPVYAGPLPSVVGLLALLDENLVEQALRESARLRSELSSIVAEARRRLHEARR